MLGALEGVLACPLVNSHDQEALAHRVLGFSLREISEGDKMVGAAQQHRDVKEAQPVVPATVEGLQVGNGAHSEAKDL